MTLMEQVEALLNAKPDVIPILEQLKDTGIPLDERWDAFTKLVRSNLFVKIKSYGDGNIDMLGPNLTMYDDLYVERHQTMTYPDMYERIVEADGDYDARLVECREKNLEAWQEVVLQNGFSAFVHDW